MQTITALTMRAHPDTVFRLASQVERWPEILPHYRAVYVLHDAGTRRVVEMHASRDGLPIRWTAEQEVFPALRRITFHHVRGVTRGMDVAWSLTPLHGQVQVEVAIWHSFSPRWPLVPDMLVHAIVGELFVENIAGKTLRCIRELAESGAANAT